MHAHRHMRMHARTHTHTYTNTHTHACMHAHTHTHTHMHACVEILPYKLVYCHRCDSDMACMCVCVWVCVHVCVCMYFVLFVIHSTAHLVCWQGSRAWHWWNGWMSTAERRPPKVFWRWRWDRFAWLTMTLTTLGTVLGCLRLARAMSRSVIVYWVWKAPVACNVSQVGICWDKFACYHTEREGID